MSREWVSLAGLESPDDDGAGETSPSVTDGETAVTPSIRKYYASWYAEAACMTVENFDEVFFGESGETRDSLNQDRIKKAQAVCFECPVIRECAEHALAKPEQYGIWAGTTPKMRETAQDLVITGLMDLDEVIDVIVEGNGYAFRALQTGLESGLRDVI
jgi:WhiB family transcriptional regulator, redox-sensing transcriptional regulator